MCHLWTVSLTDVHIIFVSLWSCLIDGYATFFYLYRYDTVSWTYMPHHMFVSKVLCHRRIFHVLILLLLTLMYDSVDVYANYFLCYLVQYGTVSFTYMPHNICVFRYSAFGDYVISFLCICVYKVWSGWCMCGNFCLISVIRVLCHWYIRHILFKYMSSVRQ